MPHVLSRILQDTLKVPFFATKELNKMSGRYTKEASLCVSDCYHALCACMPNSWTHVVVVADTYPLVVFSDPQAHFDVVVLTYDTDAGGASALYLTDMATARTSCVFACTSSNVVRMAPEPVYGISIVAQDAFRLVVQDALRPVLLEVLRPLLEQWRIKLGLVGSGGTDSMLSAASSDVADAAMAAVLNIYNTELPS